MVPCFTCSVSATRCFQSKLRFIFLSYGNPEGWQQHAWRDFRSNLPPIWQYLLGIDSNPTVFGCSNKFGQPCMRCLSTDKSHQSRNTNCPRTHQCCKSYSLLQVCILGLFSLSATYMWWWVGSNHKRKCIRYVLFNFIQEISKYELWR